MTSSDERPFGRTVIEDIIQYICTTEMLLEIAAVLTFLIVSKLQLHTRLLNQLKPRWFGYK
ncbi:hypothetical protein BU24DRAFT_20283 [Aaosphaeria arxii CBS 175.79]|uniref:Uncharacterized protein n=1 Tax=Aaosphaeria arxii CBS 175.79 TaxID=1450172 RepID=A0A6A5Y9A6_9PLEO|nr:uncharacterized protein BU24DRAFT_20283 [Aaosphaeria arxii CBS 175.79]KAF2021390.1 hypothetical protein BU24DRAFT_20283 [Aaosphaeria arxii CBS 175.79]